MLSWCCYCGYVAAVLLLLPWCRCCHGVAVAAAAAAGAVVAAAAAVAVFDELAHRNGCYVERTKIFTFAKVDFFLRSNHFDELAHRNGCYVERNPLWQM